MGLFWALGRQTVIVLVGYLIWLSLMVLVLGQTWVGQYWPYLTIFYLANGYLLEHSRYLVARNQIEKREKEKEKLLPPTM